MIWSSEELLPKCYLFSSILYLYYYYYYLKIKPSQYMFQMSLNTEQKLANQHTMKVPLKTQLLDMAETSLQKVRNWLRSVNSALSWNTFNLILSLVHFSCDILLIIHYHSGLCSQHRRTNVPAVPIRGFLPELWTFWNLRGSLDFKE